MSSRRAQLIFSVHPPRFFEPEEYSWFPNRTIASPLGLPNGSIASPFEWMLHCFVPVTPVASSGVLVVCCCCCCCCCVCHSLGAGGECRRREVRRRRERQRRFPQQPRLRQPTHWATCKQSSTASHAFRSVRHRCHSSRLCTSQLRSTPLQPRPPLHTAAAMSRVAVTSPPPPQRMLRSNSLMAGGAVRTPATAGAAQRAGAGQATPAPATPAPANTRTAEQLDRAKLDSQSPT